MAATLDPSKPVSPEVARHLADRMMAPGFSDTDALGFIEDEVRELSASNDPACRQMARLYALGFRRAFFDWAAQYDANEPTAPAAMLVALAKANAHLLAEFAAGLEVSVETRRGALASALQVVVHDSHAMLEGFSAASDLRRRGDS